MTWAVGPEVGAAFVIERVPEPLRATVTALARSSLSGKLRVELVGLFWANGPMARYPRFVCCVTVRLPVTAVAPEGTPPCPQTVNVRATCELNGPESPPVPSRESRMRAGVRAWYVAPLISGVKKPVTSKITCAVGREVGAA